MNYDRSVRIMSSNGLQHLTFYRCIPKDMIINGYEYKLGLNIDSNEFYFYEVDLLLQLLSNKADSDVICLIKLLNDTKIKKYNEEYSAFTFIIEKIFNISDFVELNKLEDKLINICPNNLKHIRNQTEEMCMKAIKSQYYVLNLIKNQTEEMCIAHFKKYPYSLKNVINQTHKICLEAVKNNGYTIQFVLNQTEEICIEALKSNIDSFKYITNRSYKVCLEAVSLNGLLLEYIDDQTEEMCKVAVNNTHYAIKFIKDPTMKFNLEYKLYKDNNLNIKLGSDYEGKIFYKIINKNMVNKNYRFNIELNILDELFNPYDGCSSGGFYFCNMNNLKDWLFLFKDSYICEVVLPNDALVIPMNTKYKANKIIINKLLDVLDFIVLHCIKDITDIPFQMFAIKKNPLMLEYFENQTLVLCIEAVKRNPIALTFVNLEFFDECIKII
jgi:hypothetical protein